MPRRNQGKSHKAGNFTYDEYEVLEDGTVVVRGGQSKDILERKREHKREGRTVLGVYPVRGKMHVEERDRIHFLQMQEDDGEEFTVGNIKLRKERR